MSAFGETPWAVARADALETEADAMERATLTLLSVRGALDNIERQAIDTAVATLNRHTEKNKEAAARLRAAA